MPREPIMFARMRLTVDSVEPIREGTHRVTVRVSRARKSEILKVTVYPAPLPMLVRGWDGTEYFEGDLSDSQRAQIRKSVGVSA